jgi:amino acid transporter
MASETSAAPSLFLRNATGLVKGWSGFDAFGYSFMSVNLVTLGMFYSLAVFAYVPTASPVLSIVLAAIAVTFLAIAYSGLIAAMPRAGGDYIWQSRVLDGIPGILTGAVVGGVASFLVANAVGTGEPLNYALGVVGIVVGGLIGRLNGGIGFILAATGWWFILAMWAPIYGAIPTSSSSSRSRRCSSRQTVSRSSAQTMARWSSRSSRSP